jgi:hypothetical protein
MNYEPHYPDYHKDHDHHKDHDQHKDHPREVVRRGGVLRAKSVEEKPEEPVHKRDFGIVKRGLL